MDRILEPTDRAARLNREEPRPCAPRGAAMHRAVPTAALLVALLPAALAPAQAQTPKELCLGRGATLDQRLAGCTALIDANTETKTETGRTLAMAFCNRGNALTERKQYAKALVDLAAGNPVDPTYACLFVNRGRALGFLGELDKAIADYDKAIALDANFALAYNNRGDAYAHKDDLDRALADFTAAIR